MYRADAYVSSADYKFKRTSPKVDRQPDREDHAMSVLLNAQRQTIDGFGSALTESAASCICALPEEKRQALLQALDLPAHLSPNAMLPVLSALYDRQALLETIKKL